MPIYYHNRFYQPLIIQIDLVENLEFEENEIFDSNVINSESIYDEKLSKYNFCIKGKILKRNYLYLLTRFTTELLKNYPKDIISKNFVGLPIDFNLISKNKKIRFLIPENGIKTFDILDGEYHDLFILKKKKCKVQFIPYLIFNNNNIYIINKLVNVMYF